MVPSGLGRLTLGQLSQMTLGLCLRVSDTFTFRILLKQKMLSTFESGGKSALQHIHEKSAQHLKLVSKTF